MVIQKRGGNGEYERESVGGAMRGQTVVGVEKESGNGERRR